MHTGADELGERTRRILTRLEQLFVLGAEPHANRPGLSPGEQAAIELAGTWMREAGLEVAADPAGNLVGRLRGHNPHLPEVWTGSHLDTVPGGGRFDGALGVVAGIEALAMLAERGRPVRTVAGVAFRDEEGWRFGRGVFGSRALCGRLERAELERRDGHGETVADALAALRLHVPPPAGWTLPGTFIEMHVEQGPRLAELGVPVGVVGAIVGMAGGIVRFRGRAGHAGTTPMSSRADALCAAADLVLGVRRAAAGMSGAVGTVGRLEVSPGAGNVVPEHATATFDVRAGDAETLTRLADAVARVAEDAAGRYGCEVAIEDRWQEPPIAMSPDVRAALARAVEGCRGAAVELDSGAGHDAGILAGSGVATGILFVRSLRGGISHRPEEHSDGDAVACGTQVLADALADLAARE